MKYEWKIVAGHGGTYLLLEFKHPINVQKTLNVLSETITFDLGGNFNSVMRCNIIGIESFTINNYSMVFHPAVLHQNPKDIERIKHEVEKKLGMLPPPELRVEGIIMEDEDVSEI